MEFNNETHGLDAALLLVFHCLDRREVPLFEDGRLDPATEDELDYKIDQSFKGYGRSPSSLLLKPRGVLTQLTQHLLGADAAFYNHHASWCGIFSAVISSPASVALEALDRSSFTWLFKSSISFSASLFSFLFFGFPDPLPRFGPPSSPAWALLSLAAAPSKASLRAFLAVSDLTRPLADVRVPARVISAPASETRWWFQKCCVSRRCPV